MLLLPRCWAVLQLLPGTWCLAAPVSACRIHSVLPDPSMAPAPAPTPAGTGLDSLDQLPFTDSLALACPSHLFLLTAHPSLTASLPSCHPSLSTSLTHLPHRPPRLPPPTSPQNFWALPLNTTPSVLYPRCRVMSLHHEVFRDLLRKHEGYESQSEGVSGPVHSTSLAGTVQAAHR